MDIVERLIAYRDRAGRSREGRDLLADAANEIMLLRRRRPDMGNIYEMLRCADRELKMRKRVYPRLVERERMTVTEADHEIRLQEQIVELLQKLVDAAEPTLFNNGSKLP
jgi:hypothetical protein